MLKRVFKIGIAVIVVLLVIIATQFHRDIPVEQLKAKYAQAPSKFMDLDGMQVHYRDEGSGFPVVLIHGTSSSLHTWDGWVDPLSKKYRVIRMDLPAFGLTGPSPGNSYGIKYYVTFIDHFLSKLGIKECYMAGNSLGGEIAWEYAAAHPEKVKKMILIDAAGYPLDKIPDAFKLARNPVTKVFMRYITPRFIFAKSLKEVYGDPSKVTDSLVTSYFELGLRQGNRGALIAEINGVRFDDTALIASIKTPTLLEWGGKDRWIPIKHAYQFTRDIKGAKLVSYPGLGHVPMEEDPVATVNDAMKFFQEDSLNAYRMFDQTNERPYSEMIKGEWVSDKDPASKLKISDAYIVKCYTAEPNDTLKYKLLNYPCDTSYMKPGREEVLFLKEFKDDGTQFCFEITSLTNANLAFIFSTNGGIYTYTRKQQ